MSDRTIENIARLAKASDIKVENFVLATLTIAFFTVSWQQRLKPLGLTVALHFVFKATDTENDWKKQRHEICETNKLKRTTQWAMSQRPNVCNLLEVQVTQMWTTYPLKHRLWASQSNCKQWDEEAAPENKKTTRMVNKFQLAHAKDIGRQISY